MKTAAVGFVLASPLLSACFEEPPAFSAPMTLGGVEVSAQVLNNGARIYRLQCTSCHGPDGSGEGPAGRALKEKPRDFRKANFRYVSEAGALPTDAELSWTIRHGKADNGMPAWPALTDGDLQAVVQYIKTFSPKWQEKASDSQ